MHFSTLTGSNLCSRCKRPMLARSRHRFLHANGMEAATYHCETCDIEAIRSVKAERSSLSVWRKLRRYWHWVR
jgi:hypothetical protein